MCGVSRMLKAQDPEVVTVFIGPCIAKKSETLDLNIQGNADYAMTFGEIRAMMRAKGVVLEPEENKNQQASVFGKRFANGGGVTAAVLECLKETNENADIKVVKCNGAAECKKALLLMRRWEGFRRTLWRAWPASEAVSAARAAIRVRWKQKKSRDKLIAEADARQVHENLKQYKMDSFSMHRH